MGKDLFINYLQRIFITKDRLQMVDKQILPHCSHPLKSTLDVLFEYELGLYCI